MILGDEDFIVERGDLVHIPRFTPHRTRPVDGPAVFLQSSLPRERVNSIKTITKLRVQRKLRRNIPERRSERGGLMSNL